MEILIKIKELNIELSNGFAWLFIGILANVEIWGIVLISKLVYYIKQH